MFGGGASSSSESSDSDHSEDEKKEIATTAKKGGYFLGGEDQEEEERVFKSGATKRAEALEKIIEETRKHAKINDFFQLDTDLNTLQTEIQKACDSNMFDEKGQKLPKNVLELLVLIEDSINEITAEKKKKMNKNNSTAYNKVKQKFKKFVSTTGDDEWLYEEQLKRFRESPPEESEEEEEEQEEESKASKVEEEDEEDEEESSELVDSQSSQDSESDDEIRAKNKEKRLAEKRAKKDAAKAKA